MTFSDKFASTKGAPFEHEGKLVHCIFRRVVSPSARIVLTVGATRNEGAVQGIRMKLDKGLLVVSGEKLADVVLWTDTAPSTVELVSASKKPAELRVWNCWRGPQGEIQAWIGNAGFLIEESGDVARFRCNSRPEVTFGDLAFEIRIGS